MPRALKLKVPEAQKDALRQLLSITVPARAALLESLASAPATLARSEFAPALASVEGIDVQKAPAIAEVIASLYAAYDASGLKLPEFAAEATRVIEATVGPIADFESVELFLTRLLSSSTNVFVPAKARSILLEHERIFVDARIISEIKPIFRAELQSGPPFAVVDHSLKIVFAEGDLRKAYYFGLDARDLDRLKEVIDRAQRKQELLLQSLTEAGWLVTGGEIS